MEEEIKKVQDGQCNCFDTKDEQKGSKVDLNDEAVHPKQTFVKNDKSSFVLPKQQNEQRVCRKKKIARRRRFDDSQQLYKRSHDLQTQFTASIFPTFPPYERALHYRQWLGRTQSQYLLLNNTIDFTNLSLSIHMGEPFVKTKAMEEAIKRIDQHNVVILSGLPGSGKTVMGNRLLLELYHKNPTCLIKINDANEFRVSISAKIRSVIFIDDMFGQLGLDRQKLEEWLPVLERVVSLVKLGICKVIISSRCSVLKAAKAYLPEFNYSEFSVMSLFSNIHIVDLSKEFQLSDEERIAIIQCHMAYLPNSMKIDEQEVLSSYRQYLGFPMLCRILTTDKLHLSHLNNEEFLIMYTAGMIDRIYHTERLKYITLVFIALCDSKLHKSILAELSSNEEALLRTIADLCSLEFHTGLTDRLIDAAECLSETFVHYKSNEDTFELTDACVYNAVCLAFGKRHPHIVLKSCTEEFIQCFLTTNIKLGYDLQPRLYVSRSQFKVLAQRVLAILSSRFDGVTRMKVLDEKDFVDYFFRYLFETDKLEPFLTKTVKKPVQNGLRSILFFCEDRLPFLAMILMQLYGLYDQEIERVLKYFLTVEKHACIEVIHKYTENRYILDAECKAEKVCLNKGYTANGDEKDFNDDQENVDKASGAVSKLQNPLIKALQKINVDTEHHKYLCEVKVDSEHFSRLQSVQKRLENEFGPRSKLADKFNVMKYEFHFDVENLWGTSSLYIFSNNLLSIHRLEFFFYKKPGNLQKLTKDVTEKCNINFPENRPTAKIVVLEVMENSHTEDQSLELTPESIQLIRQMVDLLTQEELAKIIYVVNTDSTPGIGTIDDVNIIENITNCIKNVECFPANIKIRQYDCFFMDEFELPNKISECLEVELEHIITRFSDIASKANLQTDATQLEKCYEALMTEQKEDISLAAKVILSRYQAVNSYFLKDEKLHVCVDKEDAFDEKYLKDLKEETGYEIKIDTKINKGNLVTHVKPGNKIYNHTNSYGTLGCFGIKGDSVLVGYTCEHVVRNAEAVFTEDGKQLGIPSKVMSVNGDDVSGAFIDIAAFEIVQDRLGECDKSVYCPKGNAVQMKVFQGRDLSQIQHKILYKWGATTNLKYCMFDRKQCNRVRNSPRRNHFRREYIIRSETDEPCGEPGDSGALVCYHNMQDNSILGIFFYIGSNGENTNEYVCCLVSEALDALHTRGKEEHELGDYRSFAMVHS